MPCDLAHLSIATPRYPQVSKVEFMMFILENLNLVGREEMSKILELFDTWDIVGDGVLTLRVRSWNIEYCWIVHLCFVSSSWAMASQLSG